MPSKRPFSRNRPAPARFDPIERKGLLPRLVYPENLPVVARREEIGRIIAEHQVVVLCGETGSGKTTQLPKICLEIGRGLRGFIGHTQPRRLAARTVAARIAEEMDIPLGQQVGYKIRFGDETSDRTLVKLMTDGILLAETQHDRDLRQYDTLIIDEAHERSLNIDFLLGYLKRLLPRRPDLKLIITSATIDPQRFSKHFSNAPIIEVSGRTYPVEVRYRPLQSEDEDQADLDEIEAIRGAIHELMREGPGDILLFFPTERDIRDTMESLLEDRSIDAELLPLFSRLSNDQQMKVFHPSGKRRRIILATNVAETSVTVPGIKYVIDTGLARISRYSPRIKVQRLPIEPISQASANQRKGRCGRLGPGICIRLYSEEDFNKRTVYTDPEILRTNLASVILQMKALRLGDIADFPFIEPPDYQMIKDGILTLHEIGAIDEADDLTEVGLRLSRLPVDPRVGRIVLGGQDEHCAEDILILAAALSTQDLRERPAEKADAADEAHRSFRDDQSDFVSILKLWNLLRDKQREVSNNQFRKFCKQNFLSYTRYREWTDIHTQLRDMTREHGHHKPRWPLGPDPFPIQRRDCIARAILPGLLANIATKTEAGHYLGARQIKVAIFPGSTLFKSRPLWITCAELVETTRLYARTCTPVRPDWIERAAKHLVKRTYTEPHWARATAHVVAFEKVTLWGLPLVPKRTVHYGPIDPKISRDLFIHHALVENDFRTDCPALLLNRETIARIERWQQKLRRKDLLADAAQRFEFFNQRIPLDIFSGPTFEEWRRRGDGSNWHVLELTDRDILREGTPALVEKDYPDQLSLDTLTVPLAYHYAVGEPDDGVSAVVPLTVLAQVPDGRVEWLVPGMVEEKVAELIRSLPKRLRTQFVPVADTVKRVLAALPAFGTGSLLDHVASILWKTGGEPITRDSFQLDQLPVHLKMNFQVVDSSGTILAEGRDLMELRAKLGQKVRATFATYSDPRWTRSSVTRWDFGDLPEKVAFNHYGATIYGYPTLIEQGEHVELRLLDSQEVSKQLMPLGLRRLFMIETIRELRLTMRDLPNIERLRLAYRPFGTGEELQKDLTLLICDRSLSVETAMPRTQEAFAQRAGAAWKRMYEVSRAMSKLVEEILEKHRALSNQLMRDYPPLLVDSIDDLREQLRYLLPKRFIVSVPGDRVEHMPRYLKAMDIRMSRLTNAGLAKDMGSLGIIRPLWRQYLDRQKAHDKRGLVDPALIEYRWMLEEFRVSLFAQELKTAIPVSPQKLDKAWAATKA